MALRQRAIKEVRCRRLQGYALHGAAPQLQEVLESPLFDDLDELDGLLDLELEGVSSFIEKVLAHQPASTMQRQVARARGQSEASEVHEFGRQVERRYVP